jgi:hypothetical protein
LRTKVTPKTSENSQEPNLDELFDRLAALGRRVRRGVDKKQDGAYNPTETKQSPTE